jgi:hypothetical protein
MGVLVPQERPNSRLFVPRPWAPDGPARPQPRTGEPSFGQAFTESIRIYPEGCWLFLKVTRQAQVKNIERLLAIKTAPKKRGAAAG